MALAALIGAFKNRKSLSDALANEIILASNKDVEQLRDKEEGRDREDGKERKIEARCFYGKEGVRSRGGQQR